MVREKALGRPSTPASVYPHDWRTARARAQSVVAAERTRPWDVLAPRIRAGPAHAARSTLARRCGRVDGVGQQHRNRRGSDATQTGGDPAGDLADGLVDVGHDAATVHRDAGADHRGTGLDHVGRDDRRPAGRGDEDVGLPRVGRQVGDAGVHDGDGRVRVRLLQGEEERERPADRETTTDDHDVLARDRRRRWSTGAPGCRAGCTVGAPGRPSRADRG